MGRHLVNQLREIFRLRSATLLVADPKSGILLTLASTKADLDETFGLSFLLSPEDAGLQMLKRSNRAIQAAQLIERSASLAQRLVGFGVEVIVPVSSRGAVIGLLLLGPKVSGERYSSEEMELLNLFAHHVASVLENARLFASATFDSLTGLLRREAILDLLDRELQRALRYHRPLTVGMADLDHFKETNDRYGHLVGDTLLNRVAQALQGGLRSTDAVGRYGGEEFLLVLPETDLAGARAVADKVRGIVEGIGVPVGATQTDPVTVSIGLATVEQGERDESVSVTSLIAAADRQLFRAKERGRNRIEPAA
jgi:diguanylate cyclase (GGDEF)-like protein